MFFLNLQFCVDASNLTTLSDSAFEFFHLARQILHTKVQLSLIFTKWYYFNLVTEKIRLNTIQQIAYFFWMNFKNN